MKFTDLFINRPVLAICINLLVLLGGYQAIHSLSVRQYPRSDIAVITVSTVYVGASADLVKGFITTPIERAIASADGIDYVESTSALGLSTINVHLRLNFDVNSALTQIQSKVAQVRNDLPPEAQVPVIKVESADSRFAAMYLSFYSDKLEQNQITDYLVRAVQPKITAVKGVERADILGARVFAMRIWLKPDQMASLGVSPAQISAALARNNYLATVGATKGSMISVNLVANTNLQTVEEFKALSVKEEGGTIVRLADVADVVLGAESYDEVVKFDGESATFMGVWVLPNANIIDVVREVRQIVPDIQAQLPTGIQMRIPYDSTRYINSAIREVLKTLTETILIVIVVIFLFIGSIRSTLVPIVAIPLSLVGACGLMLVFGFTINLLTLLAIVLAVGLVVDDAIVVLENVERYVEEGMEPVPAAIRGARELVGPIISMTITLAAVYIPVALQGGLTGALFKEFAITLAVAVGISGFVALTLSPMMASRLVKANVNPSRLSRAVTTRFEALRARYARLLSRSLELKHELLAFSAIFALCSIPFFMFSGKELAPREDQGIVFSILQAAPNSSMDQTALYTDQVTKVFESYPEYANSFQLVTPSSGFTGMVTKPWEQRNRTTMELEQDIWFKASRIPGLRVIVTTPPPLPGGSDFPVELVIGSTAEPAQIKPFADQLVAAAFQSGMFMFADSDMKFDQPQSEIEIDRDKVAALGLDLSQVGGDLAVMLGGNFVNRFNVQGRSYKVIPQVKRQYRLTPDQALNYYVSGPDNTLIPVSSFASIKDSVVPRTLNRFQQLNSAKIQGAQVPGVTVDQALKVLEDKAREILPRGYTLDYAGESRQLRNETASLLSALFLSFICIYLILAAQFESFRDPFIVLFGSVPLALAGALLFSFLGFTTLNIYSQVGLITLIGLVSKNGILIVEYANHLQEQGLEKIMAVQQAALTRFRPIMMTSAATVAGHFPLLLATGAGAGARNSIGVMLVCGMVIGSIFTLFVVPIIYLYVAKERKVERTA